jgi:kynurenine formamidase
MAKYKVLKLISSVPLNRYVLPGEVIELEDEMAMILMEKKCIEPAVLAQGRRVARTKGRPAKETKRQRKQRESDNELTELLVEMQNERELEVEEDGTDNG